LAEHAVNIFQSGARVKTEDADGEGKGEDAISETERVDDHDG
jgi:hypothetical protein